MQKNGKCGNIKADMVLINGRVYSPTENDKVVRGEAVIVEGGLIKQYVVITGKKLYRFGYRDH